MGVEGWAAVVASAVIQIVGLVQSSRLISYRIGQLEQQVQRLGGGLERLSKVEERAKSNSHRLCALEEERRGASSRAIM